VLWRVLVIVGMVAGSIGSALLAGAAHASFPGRSGKIAFARDAGGGSAVDEMTIGGSLPKRLVKSGDDAPAPSWSANGSKLAYVRAQGSSEIYVVDANGKHARRLTNNRVSDTAPAWSPDGSLIAFTTDRHDNAFDSQIYVMNADGSNQHALTDQEGAIDRHPTWQPVE
jgi:TolB protein